MSLQTTASSANPLTINELKTEFTGPTPSKLTNYYKGGGYVPPHTCNASVPTSGRINLLNFLGGDVVFRCAITQASVQLIDGASYNSGYSDGSYAGVAALGSRSGNTSVGLSPSSTTSATFSGFFTQATWNTKTLSYSYFTRFVVASTTDLSSTAWVSITATTGGTPTTFTRASSGGGFFDGATSMWAWTASNYFPAYNTQGTSYTIQINVI